MEYNELERSAIVKPFIKRCGFPNGVEVKTNCVGRGNNSTTNDVVTVENSTRNGFTDAIDVHRRSSDEGDDEANSCCQQSWDHQHTEPTNIKTVVS